MSTLSIKQLMDESGVGFGTSGARGLVTDMTDRVCYAYTLGFLQHLQADGDAVKQLAIAGDLRASTARIAAAVARAATALSIEPVYCGTIPSPAVALFGITEGIPSVMVTGSHIPDDRNGIKFNTPSGEISKADEAGIREQQVTIDDSLFDADGNFTDTPALPDVDCRAYDNYLARYRNFFSENALADFRIGVYQHSGVARDLLVELLESLGATVTALGRSDTFVPVDTEAVRPEDIQQAWEWCDDGDFDALVSTDGDADRPMLSDESGNWLRGDSLGMLCARYLYAEHVVTPVSSNTALEFSKWFTSVTRTRIGSPYVIAGMQQCQDEGKKKIVGYEANGGFLIQDEIAYKGKTLAPLPTRDAVIVILGALMYCQEEQLSVSGLNGKLPQSYTFSNRIKQIPTEQSQALLATFDTGDETQDAEALTAFFDGEFGQVKDINRIDGLRMTFDSGEIVHLRPSGNAPELRCYSESDSLGRARELNRIALERVQQAMAD